MCLLGDFCPGCGGALYPFCVSARRRQPGRSHGRRGCLGAVRIWYGPFRHLAAGTFQGLGLQPDERAAVLLHDSFYPDIRFRNFCHQASHAAGRLRFRGAGLSGWQKAFFRGNGSGADAADGHQSLAFHAEPLVPGLQSSAPCVSSGILSAASGTGKAQIPVFLHVFFRTHFLLLRGCGLLRPLVSACLCGLVYLEKAAAASGSTALHSDF